MDGLFLIELNKIEMKQRIKELKNCLKSPKKHFEKVINRIEIPVWRLKPLEWPFCLQNYYYSNSSIFKKSTNSLVSREENNTIDPSDETEKLTSLLLKGYETATADKSPACSIKP